MIYSQFTLINLLEDYKFTYIELKEVLWEYPEEVCFKLFYQQIKSKPKEELIDFDVFQKYVKLVEKMFKESGQYNLELSKIKSQ